MPSSRPWTGTPDDHHGESSLPPRSCLNQIAALDAKIAQLGARAAELAAAMPGARCIDADGTPDRHGRPGAERGALAGQDPGLSPDLARSIIAKTGLDMPRSPPPNRPRGRDWRTD